MTTRTLGLIGSGMIGGALARLAVAAGLEVVVSNSRGPETLADLVAGLGERARAGTVEEAARAGDVVVATIPLKHYASLPAEALAGKVVIDTMNHYPERDGHLAELETGAVTSSELLQRHLTGSRVVKAFNNLDFHRLTTSARPAGAEDRSALPIAGDDTAAKTEAAWLLDALGYDAVDIGALADSWRSEPGTPVYVQPYMQARPEGLDQEAARRWFFETPGVPVPAARVKELADQAVRRPVVVTSAEVTVSTPDGTADAYLAHPADGGPHPAVLLYMDAFGLRPHLRSMADRLAGAGYVVLVPNVFYRYGPAPVVELPDFINPAERPEIIRSLGEPARTLTPEGAMRDAAAYLDWLADSPLTADGPVGVVGYCMGAGLALRTAGTHPGRVAAAAGFHGAYLATDAADSPHLLAGHITAELYFGHADQDATNPAEQIERLDKALTEAGVRHRGEVYAGAHHGFTQADTAMYSAEASERHWGALVELLGRRL